MYGQSVFTEEVLRTVGKRTERLYEQEKLDIFAQPLPFENDSRQLDMNKPEDYAFAFEIGLKPELNIDLDDLKGSFYKIQVTDEVIDDEINRLRSRYGKMTEPETVSNEEEVLNIKFSLKLMRKVILLKAVLKKIIHCR
jgi:trigger factor